jgi:type IV pilus assembly protein PilB
VAKDSKNDLDLLTATPALPPTQAGPPSVRRRLGELLVEAGFLTPRDLEAGLASQALSGGPISHGGRQKIGQVLLEAGMINDAQLTQALGQQLSVPFVSLKHVDFSAALLARVPAELAQAHTMLPVFLRTTKTAGTKVGVETLYVAMEDPTNQEALLEVSMRAGLPVKPMIASPGDLHRAIRAFYFGEHGDPDAHAEAHPPQDRSAEATFRRQAAQTLTGHKGVNLPPKPPPPKVSHAPSAPAMSAPPPAPAGHAAPPPSPSPPIIDDDEAPEIEVGEIEISLRSAPDRASPADSGNITLLDGTSVSLPRRTRASERPAAPEMPTSHPATRELLLRLRVEGGDAGKVTAAILALLISRGLIGEADLHAELKKSL